jgi:photosystem II stability/assembly factor-like uncharacterized protein
MKKIAFLLSVLILLLVPNTYAANKAKTVLTDAGIFGVVRTISTSGAKAQPMLCKGIDGNQGFRSQKTLYVDPKNPLHLGIAIEFKGFYLSVDGGKSWKISSTGLIGYPKKSDGKKPCHTEFGYLEMDTQNSSHLVMTRAGEPGTIKDYFSENNGVYESINGGKTWKQIMVQGGVGVSIDTGFAISHTNPLVMYAGTTTNGRALDGSNKIYVTKGVIYKTADGGKTWKELPTGAPSDIGVQAISVDSLDDKTLTAITFGRIKGSGESMFGPGLGVIKSSDGGLSWKRIDTLQSGFAVVEFSKNNPLNIFGATYDSKVLSSMDGGVTWKELGGVAFPRAVSYFSDDPSGSSGLLGDDSGSILIFENNGAQFTKAVALPTLSNHLTRITSFAFGSDGSWYVAGHYKDQRSHQVGFVFKSNDHGNSWSQILNSETLK